MDPQPYHAPEHLTSRQRNILEFIVAFVADKGYPPSVREIGVAVGLTSPASVAHQLEELRRKGRIERDPSVTRGIRVIHLEAVDE